MGAMPLAEVLNGKVLLLAVAAEVEARAALVGLGGPARAELPLWTRIPLRPRIEMVVTGVGKAPASGGVARVLDPSVHGLVLSVGIAGSYTTPGSSAPLGAVVGATSSVLADEGVATPTGFDDLAKLGFAPAGCGLAITVPAPVIEALRPHCTHMGPIATVSTCSGTNALAREVHSRTGAVAEAMEGAAVALAAYRLGVPFGELRVISNTTGDRASQVWAIKDALSTLARVIGTLTAGV
jgi:futalosine hydrolase